ncbi:MAG TPA: acyltransferase [Candidatus Mediterraneibacter surreyensis]|nr:acyltransferase [Candidatus Mediterraneibacter surreyensis]
MNELQYIWAKIKYKIQGGNPEVISRYFRKKGIKIGRGCNICCNIMTVEPYLVEIGNNVTISGNVTFITHDNSVSKIYGNGYDLFGKITIGDNCFIGSHSLLLYGVTIYDNTIIAAGSVVTKSPKKGGVILAGNPAKVIGNIDIFAEKYKEKIICTKHFSLEKRKKTILESREKWVCK